MEASPHILLVTGDRGAGKSTLCTTLARAVARQFGATSVRGVVTRASAQGNRYAVLYPGEEEHLLATKAAQSGDAVFAEGPRVGPYHFSQTAVDLVNSHFSRANEHSGPGAGKVRLWILDEIGPLELTQGAGFLPALDVLVASLSVAAGHATALVVVRPALVTELKARFAAKVERLYVTRENRDALPSRLTARLFGATRP